MEGSAGVHSSARPDDAEPVAAPSTLDPNKARRGAEPEAEAEVLVRWRRGEKQSALRLLMDTYGAQVLAFARRRVGEDDAPDVRQQAFVEAWRGLDAFEGRASLRTWLFAITHNRSLDLLKRRDRITAREVSADDDDAHRSRRDAVPSSPHDRLPQRDALEHCLGQLHPALRQQVLMRLHDGLSYAEIAEIFDEEPGTIQVRVSRALPKLQRCLRSLEEP